MGLLHQYSINPFPQEDRATRFGGANPSACTEDTSKLKSNRRSLKRRCCARIANRRRVPEVHQKGARESFFDSGAIHDDQAPQIHPHIRLPCPVWPLLLLRSADVARSSIRARAEAQQGSSLSMHRRAPGRPAGWGPRRIRERGGRTCPMQPVQAQAEGACSFP